MNGLTPSESQVLINIITEWLDRNPVKIFTLQQGAELQSALQKLAAVTPESDATKAS